VRRVDARVLLAIFGGGFAGAVARAEVAEGLAHDARGWPWATFLVNVAGAFVLGWATTRLQERRPASTYRQPLIGTGFCGALTTFSTLQLEVLDLLDAHRYGVAAGYVAASAAAGYAAVHLATGLARRTRVLAGA
jgi:CrcB protein